MKNFKVWVHCSGTLLWLEQPYIPWLAQGAQSLDTSLIFLPEALWQQKPNVSLQFCVFPGGQMNTQGGAVLILPLFPGSSRRLVGKAAPCSLPFLQGFLQIFLPRSQNKPQVVERQNMAGWKQQAALSVVSRWSSCSKRRVWWEYIHYHGAYSICLNFVLLSLSDVFFWFCVRW